MPTDHFQRLIQRAHKIRRPVLKFRSPPRCSGKLTHLLRRNNRHLGTPDVRIQPTSCAARMMPLRVRSEGKGQEAFASWTACRAYLAWAAAAPPRWGRLYITLPSGKVTLASKPPLRPSFSGWIDRVTLSPGFRERLDQPLRP